jgi:hypothetical protein
MQVQELENAQPEMSGQEQVQESENAQPPEMSELENELNPIKSVRTSNKKSTTSTL